ncbi:MAG: lysine--tRNA ligase [Chloroflexi bacterium]|nr:lysine--tRNA ligase [Chloroflexota bacterium]
MPERGQQLTQSRQQKLLRLREQHIDPYPPRFPRTHTNQEAVAYFQRGQAGRTGDYRTRKRFAVAGRITGVRPHGKATFLDLRDGTQKLQVHLRRDILKKGYDLVDNLDLGDLLGARGILFRTRAGEVTIQATEVTLLAKAMRPPPEKWHGLKDVEIRYRQRYLDLMANQDILPIFQARSRTITEMRSFLINRGYIEVDTPVLVPVAAGAMARPFVTHHHALNRTLYLRIATELYLKRLIVGGMDRVFEIGRVFRNEGIDMDHNPEFTLLESYEAYADYNDVMEMVEQMVATVAQAVLGGTVVAHQGNEIDLSPPWQRVSLYEAIHKHTGIDIESYPDAESLGAEMRKRGVEASDRMSRGRLLDKLLGSAVEPHLVQPTFLMDYPVEMSPLAKAKPDNPHYVERFEAFAGGMEIANAFTELNDPAVQRQRFQEQEALRAQYGGEDFDRLDEDYLTALEYGMPPTGGLGIGIDRLVMLLTGQRTIRDVVLFPQLRSRDTGQALPLEPDA